ncbi:hypothetical protein B0J13DRAFT_642157, partial [Dactylonectria estremocensis]
MDATASNLSSQKYGYGFVVSTTQASINSGLLEYLNESTQPYTYLCFLVDPNTGNPTDQISLDDLLAKTGGVNPFDIPTGTPTTDPRIQTLTGALFAVGVKIRMGMPPGVLPKDLPLILELGNSANNATFRMFCSDFQVIQNTPRGGWVQKGSWDVWAQQPGSPWYVQTTVDLVNADLDKELNTPYFLQHPDQQAQILSQLKNLSSTAFSLQQLLFDLDSAVMETVPTFVGIPAGSNAQDVLQKSFVSIYSVAAKNYGEPLLAVTAVAQDTPDPSQIQMTSFEREVSQYRDTNGNIMPNPTPDQVAVTTLDHLCMTNSNPFPGAAGFSWNWVQPQDANSESGVIAINRQVFSQYMLTETILPAIQESCVSSNVSVTAKDGLGDWKYTFSLLPGQTPQTSTVTDPKTGAQVINIAYTSQNDPNSSSSDSYLAFSIQLDIMPHYTCQVSFIGSTITIVQRLWVWIYVEWDATGEGINGYDLTLTDVYDMSVAQNGGLQITRDPSKQTKVDNSQDPDRSWLVNIFTGVNDAVNQIKSQITQLVPLDMESIVFSAPQSFVFPGAKVFTYSSAIFSDCQDLVCDITYVNPNQAIRPPRMLEASTPQIRHVPQAAPSTLPSRLKLAAPTTSVTMSHTSDMIQNYIQGDIVAPTGKFEALQTDDGHSMLFGMNTSNVLHVIVEQSGTSTTGWAQADLSSTLLAVQFPGNTSTVVRTFDVGQSALDGTIGMAMAVNSGASDSLFLSLYNSSSDTSWTTKPSWTPVPFDAPNTSGTRPILSIVGIMFAETQNNQQYIVVDVDRSSANAVKDIARYYVDPLKASGTFWTHHDVPVDIEDGSYQSCVGRAQNGYVDGIYTSGTAGASAQLFYVPVINVFGGGPPLPSRLSLPGGAQASAIATARNTNTSSSLYGTTDLYTISGCILYRFPAENQVDGSVGTPLINNTFFWGTTQLSAMTHDGVTTIWGKNASDQVYYLSCPSNQLSVPGAWSAPVPILTGVELMSPYLNRSDGGNTIFASGGNILQRLTQATDTDAKIWRADEIKLQALPTEEPLSFNSYTTTIQIVDNQNLPAGGVNVSITAASRTPVYLNGLYYVLSQTPVTVTADATGTVTVVEAVQDSISGTMLTVSCDGGVIPAIINPMEKSFLTMASLNIERSLRGANFPTNTVAGGTQGTSSSTPLVASSTSSNDINVVVDSMSKLNTVYGSVRATQSNELMGRSEAIITSPPCMRVVPHTLFLASPSFGSLTDDIAIAVGDLFRWLKSGVQSVIHILKDAASDAWHFLATIAGKVYRAVLDSVDAVVGAVEWIFNTIKTGIEDVIHYLEFLFDWDDVTRTKDLIYNTAKTAFDGQIANVEKSINQWAGVTDWSTSIGQVAAQPASASATNPAAGQTSGSQMLSSHFKNHGADLTIVGSPPSDDLVQQVVNDLLNALEQEGQVLSAVYSQLKTLASNFSSMTVGQALKQLAGIFADGVLSSVQVVADAVFNILTDLASAAVSLLDTKIHIPIISDILNAIGIPDVSFLDLLCWIPAVAYTVVYKIANNKPPFPDNADVQALIAANSWDTLQALLSQQPDSILPVSAETAKSLYVAGHSVAGFMSFMSVFVNTFEAEGPSGDANPWGIPSAVMGVIGAASNGIADIAFPKDPVQDMGLKIMSGITTTATVTAKIIFSGPAQKRFKAKNPQSFFAVDDGRATGAIVNVVFVFPAVCVTVGHFYELSSDEAGADRSAAIVGEVANLTSYVSRVSYCAAVNDEDPESRQIPIGVMAVANVTTAGLQTAQAVIN